MGLSRRSFLSAAGLRLAASAAPEFVDVFRSGEDGYHTYRIPALIAARKGALLAFCEGRRNSSSDTGDIDLLLKRSADGGRTWSAQQVVVDHGPDTIGNPCPVLDRKTGAVWLPLTGNPGAVSEKQIRAATGEGTRTVWMTRSTDGGATWAPPVEITAAVKPAGWTWYATGPGIGIQLRTGRLLVPCDHARHPSMTGHSHVIYSDDGGRTWKLGGSTAEHTNESQVVELGDGSLLLNMRSTHGKNRRAVARSRDGGLSWSQVTLDGALVEPVCQASLLRRGKVLLFSNPADTKRVRMTVRASFDWGRTWPKARLLHEGPSAYSCLCALRGDTIGCLFENGRERPYEKITLARFSLRWLTT